jgi:hypothetical protein
MPGETVDHWPIVPKKLVPGQDIGPLAEPLQKCRPRAACHADYRSKKNEIFQDSAADFDGEAHINERRFLVISPFSVVAVLTIAVLSIFFYFAATRNKCATAFFVGFMTVSASVSVVGLPLLVREDTTWEGVVLICFGLAMLLATMVACVSLRQKQT